MNAAGNGRSELGEVRERITRQIVGRSRELELLLAAVASGRDILLEGPPGTSKTTMLKAITHEWGIPLLLVEGNAELTQVKLIGHHHPARVLREDYGPENFVPGPLVRAMREGGFLYIEEFNRAPEDTLNTLLMAIGDRQIVVPRVGVVDALPTFRVIASMNPFDNVGTTRLSSSVHDRLCRLAVGYQDESSERGIVTLRANVGADDLLGARLVKDAVTVTRGTRVHPDVRQGSSVRGAIDAVLLAAELAALRGVIDPGDVQYPGTLLDALIVSLSGRIQLEDAAQTTPEAVLKELWEKLASGNGAAAAPG